MDRDPWICDYSVHMVEELEGRTILLPWKDWENAEQTTGQNLRIYIWFTNLHMSKTYYLICFI